MRALIFLVALLLAILAWMHFNPDYRQQIEELSSDAGITKKTVRVYKWRNAKGEWQITDQLSLTTGRGIAASRGPGLTLNWNPDHAWKLALGARYEKLRFRLDEQGTVANGVGQDRAVPLTLLLSYQPSSALELSLLGGVAYAGELQLEDADGNVLQDTEYDDAPYLGLLVNIKL